MSKNTQEKQQLLSENTKSQAVWIRK